jgi:hypothetical protein
MDYVMTMTVAGKSFYVSSDSGKRKQIVRREKIMTTTGMQTPQYQNRRQQLYLTLAAPLAK